MDKSIKTEITKAEITRSKLSLTKETLRQLKVRTGLKAGIVSPTVGCGWQPGGAAVAPYVPTAVCSGRF